MSEFISRKQLEIHHSCTYEMRERLKQLGCEWDGIARAWIAPSLEVRELCYEILERSQEKDESVRVPYFGRQWHNIDLDAIEKENDVKPLEEAASVIYTPNRKDAIKIAGEGNVQRYWNDEIPQEAALILASGETNVNKVYEQLEESGWKTRSVSLLWDIVKHFRAYPPVAAIDEKLEHPILEVEPTIDPEEMQGSISVICDSENNPQLLALKFPYDLAKVNYIKSCLDGRRWNASKKRWEIPVKLASKVFKKFPHFQRSPRAQEIEKKL